MNTLVIIAIVSLIAIGFYSLLLPETSKNNRSTSSLGKDYDSDDLAVINRSDGIGSKYGDHNYCCGHNRSCNRISYVHSTTRKRPNMRYSFHFSER